MKMNNTSIVLLVAFGFLLLLCLSNSNSAKEEFTRLINKVKGKFSNLKEQFFSKRKTVDENFENQPAAQNQSQDMGGAAVISTSDSNENDGEFDATNYLPGDQPFSQNSMIPAEGDKTLNAWQSEKQLYSAKANADLISTAPLPIKSSRQIKRFMNRQIRTVPPVKICNIEPPFGSSTALNFPDEYNNGLSQN